MREQLKKSEKLQNEYQKKQLVERMSRNGITPDDLKRSFDEGYDEGIGQSTIPILKTCYAAFCLVLNEYGFDKDKILEALLKFDNKVTYSITEDEYVGEVLDKLGLQIEFGNSADRIITDPSFDLPAIE